MARLLSLCVATLLALLSVSGCGGGTTDTGGQGSGTNTASPDGGSTGGGNGGTIGSNGTSNGGGGNGGGTSNGSGNSGSDGFSYLPWGPDDPPIPTQYAAMAASSGSSPDCDGVAEAQPGGAFWETAVAVCRAITGQGPWPETTTVPDPPSPDNPYQACLDAELAEMLRAALRWHAENPNRQPVVSYPSRSSTSPCQARIYGVRVLTSDDLVPGEGYPEGKVGIAITASALEQDPTVTVDGESVEFSGDFNVDQPAGDGLATIVVLAPAPPQRQTAQIKVSTYRGVLETGVELPGAQESTATTENTTTGNSTTESSTTGNSTTDSTTENSTPADSTSNSGGGEALASSETSSARFPAEPGQSSTDAVS